MRKFFLNLLSCIFLFALFVSAPDVRASAAVATATEAKSVYVGGNTAGFLLNMGGVQVIAVNEVITKEGNFSPAKEAGVQNGDVILKIDGISVNNIEELNEKLNASTGKSLLLTVRRQREELEIAVQPQKDVSGKYKIGVLIRDTLSGIGTITYIDRETGRFGALGHAVYDEENRILNVNKGKVYDCNVVSVTKGVRGKAGELKGLFVGDGSVGASDTINECGLYGSIDENFDYSKFTQAEIAPLSEAKIGEAYIYSTISGLQPEKFNIAVVKVDEYNKDKKNFVIKITDKNLIERTGGIVQGMSGSPILHDGKLIGAVTHVFLNDPTRGYGIGIENMLGN
ncbi:MAG: SpoIVB peptidase [Clostridia bacterium]|nr:SpoIVB peptidase [Clostridia bacterium]